METGETNGDREQVLVGGAKEQKMTEEKQTGVTEANLIEKVTKIKEK